MNAVLTNAHDTRYGNNCACADHTCCDEKCFKGDVQATIDYGFESIKLDGCGCVRNITLYSELFNATGVHVMLENCHNGNPTCVVSLRDWTTPAAVLLISFAFHNYVHTFTRSGLGK